MVMYFAIHVLVWCEVTSMCMFFFWLL